VPKTICVWLPQRRKPAQFLKPTLCELRWMWPTPSLPSKPRQALVRIAVGDLNTAMGLPPELPLEIDAGLPEPAPPAPAEIHEALDMADRERPEIKAARRRVDAAGATLAAARSAFGPKVRAEGAFGWRDDDSVPHDKDWMASVSIELPIFTGFSRRHRVGRTKAELSREEAGLEALRLAVRQEVWAAHSRLQESRERVRAAEPLVRDARESAVWRASVTTPGLER
jgi:outer membrane protein